MLLRENTDLGILSSLINSQLDKHPSLIKMTNNEAK